MNNSLTQISRGNFRKYISPGGEKRFSEPGIADIINEHVKPHLLYNVFLLHK